MLLLLLTVGQSALAADLLVGPGQTYASVEDAVQDAVSGDRVLVDPGVYDEPELDVVGLDLTIEAAAGPGTVTLQLGQGQNLFFVDGGASLALVDLDVDALGDGRLAEVIASSLVVDGCTVFDTATPNPGQAGGSVSVTDGSLVVVASTFDAALSPNKDGGHFNAVRSVVDLVDSTFASGDGGAGGVIAAIDASVVTIDGSTLIANTGDTGAAVDVIDTDLTVRRSTLTGNVSAGGTIRCLRGASCVVEGSTFEGNVADTGAMIAVEDTVSTAVTGSVLCGTPSGASLVDLAGTSATITRTVFVGNTLGSGVVHVAADAAAAIVNNHFVGAQATAGGAAVLVEGPTTLVNNLVAYNAGGGPVVEVLGGALTEGYNLFWANTPADSSVALAPTDLFADPLIAPPAPASCDLAGLVPPTDSPAIDAGDPTLLDTDGTVADIGAYGDLVGNPLTDGDDDDGDGVPSPLDCDDTVPTTFPGAPELACNGVDDDCDPATTDVFDGDGDGILACDGDCDDGDAAVYPGAAEQLCNFTDDDCDPATVDGVDADGDGANQCTDCDDADPARSPGFVEARCNGVDDDCRIGTVDDEDADGDLVPFCAGDCDDLDGAVFPGQVETTCNGADDDCDPATPDAGDLDVDGVDQCAGDCDDTDPLVLPGAVEAECNGLDDDCDATTPDAWDVDLDGISTCDGDCNDENANLGLLQQVWFDEDEDDWGTGDPFELCGLPSNGALQPGDCDDQDPTVNPGTVDLPYDAIDQDCDGADLDDLDGDGFRLARDCADDDAGRFPGNPEVTNDGVDQDCSGSDTVTEVVGGAGLECGCASAPGSSGSSGAPLGALGLLWLRRRRR